MDGSDTVVVAFLGTLLFVFAFYQYLTWHRTSVRTAVLMNMTTDIGKIRGVEQEQRVICPRKAQDVLRSMVTERQMRGVLFRDGPTWVVYAGRSLTVSPTSSVQDQRQRLLVYYMREAPPQMEASDDKAPKLVSTLTTTGVDNKQGVLKDMTEMKNSAINLTALMTTGGPPVTRYKQGIFEQKQKNTLHETRCKRHRWCSRRPTRWVNSRTS